MWLDSKLAELGISSHAIAGYEDQVATHGKAAQAIAEGRADAGIAIATVAHNYDLGFRSLAWEPYDLVLTSDIWEMPQVQGLIKWLALPATQYAIHELGGYRIGSTGQVVKIRREGRREFQN